MWFDTSILFVDLEKIRTRPVHANPVLHQQYHRLVAIHTSKWPSAERRIGWSDSEAAIGRRCFCRPSTTVGSLAVTGRGTAGTQAPGLSTTIWLSRDHFPDYVYVPWTSREQIQYVFGRLRNQTVRPVSWVIPYHLGSFLLCRLLSPSRGF